MLSELFDRLKNRISAETNAENTAQTPSASGIPEDYRHAKDLVDTLVKLERDLHGNENPTEIAEGALKAGCEFYDAEWCGVLDINLDVGVFTPYWWYTPVKNDRTTELFWEFEFAENFPRWVEAVKNRSSIVVPDTEAIRDSQPEEYVAYKRLEVEGVIGVPYKKRSLGFLAIKNPQRYKDRPEFLQLICTVIATEVDERKLIDTMRASTASDVLLEEDEVRINLFGGLEIETSRGKMSEADIKSPKGCKILVYLLLNRNRKLSSRLIADDLWPEDETDGAMRNIRALLYRLRQNTEFLWDENLIVTTQNGYQLNENFRITTDCQQFDECCQMAQRVSGAESKIELLQKAVGLYKGPLFPSAMTEQWMSPFESQYRLGYMNAIKELLELLYREGNYSDVYRYSVQALSMDSTSVDFWYWNIFALRNSGSAAMARKEMRTAHKALPAEDFERLRHRLDQCNAKNNTNSNDNAKIAPFS